MAYPLDGYWPLHIKINKVATTAGVDHSNLSYQLEENRRKGKPLPAKLKEKIRHAILTIHNEVQLHTYEARICGALLDLRLKEDLARGIIEALGAGASVDEIEAAFERATAVVADSFIDTVRSAFRMLDEPDELDQAQRTTVYLASAALHTLVVVWEDAAKRLAAAAELQADWLAVGSLSFEHLWLEEITTVFDVAEKAFEGYATVEGALQSVIRARASDAEIAKSDAAIVHLNMASLASYGIDWSNASDPYLAIGAESTCKARQRAAILAADGKLPLKRAVEIFETYPWHVLIARNLLYMALQQDQAEVLRDVQGKLAEFLEIDPARVWTDRLGNREPLADELHLNSKFNADRHPYALSQETK